MDAWMSHIDVMLEVDDVMIEFMLPWRDAVEGTYFPMRMNSHVAMGKRSIPWVIASLAALGSAVAGSAVCADGTHESQQDQVMESMAD